MRDRQQEAYQSLLEKERIYYKTIEDFKEVSFILIFSSKLLSVNKSVEIKVFLGVPKK